MKFCGSWGHGGEGGEVRGVNLEECCTCGVSGHLRGGNKMKHKEGEDLS